MFQQVSPSHHLLMHHLRRGQWRNSSQDLCDLTFQIVRVEGLGWRIWFFFRCTIAGKWGGKYETKSAELCKCVSESDLDWPGSQVVSPVTSFGNIGNNSKRHKIRRKRWWRLQMRRTKNVFDDADDDWTVTKHRYNIYIHMYIRMYIYTCIFMHFLHTYIHIYLCTYIYTYVCMYVHYSSERTSGSCHDSQIFCSLGTRNKVPLLRQEQDQAHHLLDGPQWPGGWL